MLHKGSPKVSFIERYKVLNKIRIYTFFLFKVFVSVHFESTLAPKMENLEGRVDFRQQFRQTTIDKNENKKHYLCSYVELSIPDLEYLLEGGANSEFLSLLFISFHCSCDIGSLSGLYCHLELPGSLLWSQGRI